MIMHPQLNYPSKHRFYNQPYIECEPFFSIACPEKLFIMVDIVVSEHSYMYCFIRSIVSVIYNKLIVIAGMHMRHGVKCTNRS